MWATGEEHVRVLAFMCIRKSLTLQPNLFEFVLKVSLNRFNTGYFDFKYKSNPYYIIAVSVYMVSCCNFKLKYLSR